MQRADPRKQFDEVIATWMGALGPAADPPFVPPTAPSPAPVAVAAPVPSEEKEAKKREGEEEPVPVDAPAVKEERGPGELKE